MISLNPTPSNQPLEPGTNLIAHLAASPRPAIIHYAADGRTELSGRVAINWATKMTHLIDSYGIAAPDQLLVSLPVTWRSLALALGVAWTGTACTDDPAEAAGILTDQPEHYLSAAAELFVTHRDDVDAALIDVDDEVLSHADQALLPVPDIIGNAQTTEQPSQHVKTHPSGVVIRALEQRLDAATWWAIVDAWRRTQPVVLVEDINDAQLARIITTERLG